MRCASVLLESKHLNVMQDGRRVEDDSNDDDHDDDGNHVVSSRCSNLTDEEIYDAPRGLTRMPIRRGTAQDEDDWTVYDSKESAAIMQSESSVRSKMIKSDDGEMFFSIITKRR